MLKFSGHRTPTRIFAHGFLTVDGQKMSKSRGTFITAESYVQQQLNPEWLRYYFAAKLNASMEDIDLNFDDFIARVNSDLVGKLINIASRTAGFIQQRFAGRVLDVATIVASTPILQQLLDAAPAIQALYEAREYSKAMRSIMELADGVNTYIAEQAPWALNKQANDDASVLPTLHQICSVCLESFRILVLYLKPVLPVVAQHVETMLATGTQTWADVSRHLSSATLIAPYQHLMQRVERKQIDALIAANTESLQATPA
jgi:methionyl-tRNA synthetase